VKIRAHVNVEIQMPNVTIHLDEETHRLAKIHAAQTGSSLSKSFRDHIRSVMKHGLPAGELAILERYSRSELPAKDAMASLGLQCIEDLMSATIAAGLGLPHVERKAALQMARPLLSRTRARSHA
jgi:hypothetical protein